MCWSIPARLIEIKGNVGIVELEGLKKDIKLDLIESPVVGDYLLVHAGYAIQKVDSEEANFTNEYFKEGE